MLSILVSLSSCAYYLQHEEKSFLQWMRLTNQFYTGAEYHIRFGIYLTNSRLVREHNKQNKKFKLTLNKFAAYTPSEYKSLLSAHHKNLIQNKKKAVVMKTNTDSIDWRDKGVVNEIQDTLQCNSHWAFAVIQALESNHAILTGKLEKFSEQHLVDCVKLCAGCDGGDAEISFNFLVQSGGFVYLRSDYEYTASKGECKFSQCQPFGPVLSEYLVSADGDDELAAVVETMGPVSSYLDAKHPSFQLYDSGIYEEPACSSDFFNLNIGVVGFGVEDQTKYWIVRNAWGKAWGESGYMRIIRLNNECGIASWAMIPRL